LFLFNFNQGLTMERMGDPEGMKQRVADNQPHGMHDGPKITFV